MANPFGTEAMAAGYATSRPAVHPRVMARVYERLEKSGPFRRALDVGCGAGVSTNALTGFATKCIGLEPVEAMLRLATTIAPSAEFIAGTAEAIPLCDHAVDLISAAGSLNYANLDLFFPEAARVLTADGVLVIYDFSPGRSFSDENSLDEWFTSFMNRYPPPANEGKTLSPHILNHLNSGFRMRCQQHFKIGLPLRPDFYLDYILTETNVAAAIRSGVPHSEIRSWCAETLAPVWNGADREVQFRGYFVCMSVT